MKLWYQCMSRQAAWGGYPAVLRSIRNKVKVEDSEIQTLGITVVHRYGRRGRLVAVNRMQVERLIDLGAAFEPRGGAGPDRWPVPRSGDEEFGRRRGSRDCCGGVVMALPATAKSDETSDSVPILNGTTNLVKLGEMAVKMNRVMGGRFTSKKCVYGPPRPNQFGQFRRYYGADIYSTVSEV